MKCIAWGTLAAGLLLVADPSVRADDLVRTVGTSAAVTTLKFDGNATTQPVLFGLFRHGHRGYYGYNCYGSYYPTYGYGCYGYSPYNGYGYGYGGYPYGGGYGAYTGYGYGGYPYGAYTGYGDNYGYSGYGYGGYGGAYGGYSGYGYGGYPYGGGYGGYSGYGYSGYPYGGGYGSYTGYGYGYGGGYGYGYPSYGYDRYYGVGYNTFCNGTQPMPPATKLGAPRQPAAPNGGTFQYDGGPNNPAPIPSSAPARPTIPRDGKFVSLPRESSGAVHPAVLTTVRPAPAQPRYTYPAYGERN